MGDTNMHVPVEIFFKDVKKTDEIMEIINRRIARLEKICSYINSCRIAVEKPQFVPECGSTYRFRIDITIPHGHEIIAERRADKGSLHDPLSIVIGKTFDIAERKIKKLVNQQHRQTKKHEAQLGVISKIMKDEGYGFLITIDDSREIYFHKNSVLRSNFDKLVVGTIVRYVDEEGLEGPQATTVDMNYARSVSA
jgi:cold shock CspA family protein